MKAYTVQDIMALLDMKQEEVYHLLQNGRLEGEKIGGRWVVTEWQLKKYERDQRIREQEHDEWAERAAARFEAIQRDLKVEKRAEEERRQLERNITIKLENLKKEYVKLCREGETYKTALIAAQIQVLNEVLAGNIEAIEHEKSDIK